MRLPNGVLGKLLGGVFGFMVGGPVGAAVGVLFGHNFDHGWRKTAGTSQHQHRAQIRDTFYSSAFQVMGYLAKADGRVSEAEIAAARALMDYLQLDAAQRQTAIACFNAGKQSDFAAESALAEFAQIADTRSGLLQQWIEMLLHLAHADGNMHPQTRAALLEICRRLGINRIEFETMLTLFRARRWAHQPGAGEQRGAGRGRGATGAITSLNEAYALLGLERTASTEQIKLAYRRLVQQHHPDKLVARDASALELERATEKTREITAAYELIRQARGF